MVNLSEALVRVPGLVVNNRNNYAQDLQISSRGFGARAGFGVRGMRLYADGIPASGPDGQGQVSHFDLAGAQRMEVLRGPFSVLYGNSSGGVIALFSAPVRAAARPSRARRRQRRPAPGARCLARRWATRLRPARQRQRCFELDGFRPQSAAERAGQRCAWAGAAPRPRDRAAEPPPRPAGAGPAGPDARAVRCRPGQTTPQATQFNTRKTAARRRPAPAGATASTTARCARAARGLRRRARVTQWLAIPPATQANPRHGGGVIDFDRATTAPSPAALGAAAGPTWWPAWRSTSSATTAAATRTSPAPAPAHRAGRDRRAAPRRGPTAPPRDALRAGRVGRLGPAGASAGLRSGRVTLRRATATSPTATTPAPGSFRYTNPVLGLRWQPRAGLALHASVARGFESPTLGELAYRPDGSGGFNTGCSRRPAGRASWAAKWRSARLSLDATVFVVRTDDEIGVASTNAGGRAAFQNVGRTAPRGRAGRPLAPPGLARAAGAGAPAGRAYRDGFLACAGMPCTAPSVPVPAGNRIAGTQRAAGLGRAAAWRDCPWGEWAWSCARRRRTANDRNTTSPPASDGPGGAALERQLALGAGRRLCAVHRRVAGCASTTSTAARPRRQRHRQRRQRPLLRARRAAQRCCWQPPAGLGTVALRLQGLLQARLQRRRQCTHLVQEQGAAQGLVQGALRAEEAGLERGRRSLRTGHGDEGAVRARALSVDGASQQLLAGAGLAQDQQGQRAVAYAVQAVDQRGHAGIIGLEIGPAPGRCRCRCDAGQRTWRCVDAHRLPPPAGCGTAGGHRPVEPGDQMESALRLAPTMRPSGATARMPSISVPM
jgi:iron complex outermembrane recepter protein